jgi:radical SAM protein with 4Fe4S-binding SPASM domain
MGTLRVRDLVDALYYRPWIFFEKTGIPWLLRKIRPLELVFFIITLRCNRTCSYCFVPKKDTEEMSLALVKIGIQNIRTFKRKPQCHLIGGEPLLHVHFKEICELFIENNTNFSISTNGILLTKHINFLAHQRNLVTLYISIHTGTYAALKNIGPLAPLMGKQTEIVFQITVHHLLEQEHTRQYLLDLAKLKPTCIVIKHSQTVFLHNEKLDYKRIASWSTIRSVNSIPIVFSPPLLKNKIKPYYTDHLFPSKNKHCLFPWFALKISANGNVKSCHRWMGTPLGNILKSSLYNIWHSAGLKQKQQEILMAGCDQPGCERCCWREY